MTQTSNSKMGILLVDDDPTEGRLLERAMKRSGVDRPFFHVLSGEEALQYLRREAPHEDAFHVGLLLLDLNMPGLSGHETLRRIRADQQLRPQPVVILTTSTAQSDVETSFEIGANAFVTKPDGLHELTEALQAIDKFWFGVSHMPQPPLA